MRPRPLLLLLVLLAGCSAVPKKVPAPPPPPPFAIYRAPDFPWEAVSRVAILPLANESAYFQAGEDIQRLLHSSFQQLGRCEAVPIPSPILARLVRQMRETGRFDEGELIHLARCTGAQVILAGTLTHYSPYLRPRIGLSLQAISPELGRVVASVDGVWDATAHPVAGRARLFYSPQKTLAEKVCDRIVGTIDDSFACDLVLESPHLYGQFVCSEAVRLMAGDTGILESLRLTGDQPATRAAPPPCPSCAPRR